jgi:hypothetical protein
VTRSRTGALLGYAAVFIALSLPLAIHPLAAVISHWDADIEHSLWVQWWFVHALTSPGAELFRTDMIAHPHVVGLQLADLNLAVNAASALLSPILGLAGAYNALLLCSFVASGGLCARLARQLGAEPAAAWLAGLTFAASPYWQSCALNGWGYLVHIWVFPLAFLALEHARAGPSPRRIAGVALALALAFHVTPYYFLYLSVLMGLYLVPDAPRLWRGLRAGGVGPGLAFVLPLGLLIAPRALPMWWAAAEPLAVHHGPQNTALAASLVELVLPSASTVEARVPRLGYGVVFVGYLTLATLALGAWVSPRRALYARWGIPGLVMVLLALGPALKLVDGAPLDILLPTHWLQRLPAFELLTNHWRWMLPATFCFSALLGPAATDLVRYARARELPFARWGVALLGLAFACEVVLVFPIPLEKPLWWVRPSPIAAQLREHPEIGAIIDRTRTPKLNQTVHGKPLSLGWLPRLPAAVRAANERLVAACRGLDPDCLAAHGIDALILTDETALLITRRGGRVVALPLQATP